MLNDWVILNWGTFFLQVSIHLSQSVICKDNFLSLTLIWFNLFISRFFMRVWIDNLCIFPLHFLIQIFYTFMTIIYRIEFMNGFCLTFLIVFVKLFMALMSRHPKLLIVPSWSKSPHQALFGRSKMCLMNNWRKFFPSMCLNVLFNLV